MLKRKFLYEIKRPRKDKKLPVVLSQEEVANKPGWNNLIRVDYHGSKEVPKGTCHAILKDAGIKK
ncbi:MAG: hypothetical protein QMD03_03110 [Syntrophales bacterium]|nr:hypothetical protein [Syntrophales bacterium]